MAEPDSSRVLMTGNEAIARGAIEAGVRFCSSYPGTPSTEIAATIMQYAEKLGIYAEWSVNEKVALEAAAGASWAGLPAICSMKSLGLNVASDFLLNVNLSGSGSGGLVVVVCDDPRGHSSSNEQDSRFYAKAARVPLLEPSSYQEAKEVMTFAYDLSRKHEIPVIVRSTTRLSHSRGIVELGESREWTPEGPLKVSENLFNIPNPHLRHRDLLLKIDDVAGEFENCSFNRIHGPTKRGILTISSGICQRYAEEAVEKLGLQHARRLGLVTTHPIPKGLVADAVKRASEVLFLEEVDSFIEDEIRAISTEEGIGGKVSFHGRRSGEIPGYGEMNTGKAIVALREVLGIEPPAVDQSIMSAIEDARNLLIPRPLTFCAGCTHRNAYWAIRKVRENLGENLVVAGDIGCYSLGVFYDEAMNTMQAMGSGIGVATGLGQLERFGLTTKIVAVAGDSTFFHACIPALVNAKHKKADLTFLILDNSTTAMTGFQQHPGSSEQSTEHRRVSIEQIVRAVEPDIVEVADATDIPTTLAVVNDAITKTGLKVIILNSICRLEEQRLGETYDELPGIVVDSDSCVGEDCMVCVSQFGCNALGWESRLGIPIILDHVCTKCGACIAVCPQNAIMEDET